MRESSSLITSNKYIHWRQTLLTAVESDPAVYCLNHLGFYSRDFEYTVQLFNSLWITNISLTCITSSITSNDSKYCHFLQFKFNMILFWTVWDCFVNVDPKWCHQQWGCASVLLPLHAYSRFGHAQDTSFSFLQLIVCERRHLSFLLHDITTNRKQFLEP